MNPEIQKTPQIVCTITSNENNWILQRIEAIYSTEQSNYDNITISFRGNLLYL